MTVSPTTFLLGKEGPDKTRYLQLSVSADLPSVRTPDPNESAEDKKKKDEEFDKRTISLKERLEKEKRFEKWVYLVPDWNLEQILKRRDEIVSKASPSPSPENAPLPEPSSTPSPSPVGSPTPEPGSAASVTPVAAPSPELGSPAPTAPSPEASADRFPNSGRKPKCQTNSDSGLDSSNRRLVHRLISQLAYGYVDTWVGGCVACR